MIELLTLGLIHLYSIYNIRINLYCARVVGNMI
jgi:hypothetical protein